MKVKGGRERTIPFPKDVRQAIDHYLKLDAVRRRTLHSDGDDAFIFQPLMNFRTLEFERVIFNSRIASGHANLLRPVNDGSQIGQPLPKPPCPICSNPLDLQSRDPLTWWCALCKKWFEQFMQRLRRI